MFTHAKLWSAIDQLAQLHGYSASGLAKKAGLDPTSFNKSKRKGPDGKKRWPSTESLSKVLAATGSTMGEFIALMGEKLPEDLTETAVSVSSENSAQEQEGAPATVRQEVIIQQVQAQNRNLPLLPDEIASDPATFNEYGFPAVTTPSVFTLPEGQPALSNEAWALEITGSSFAPYYQEGDILLIDPNGPARAGDPFLIRRKSEDRLAVYRGQSANPAIGIPLGRIMGAFYSMYNLENTEEELAA